MDADDAVKLLFPDVDWFALWQSAALTPFVPSRGQKDDPVPMLEVHYLEPSGARAIAVFALAFDGFNDWQTRRQILRTLGERWALDGWQVLALRFAVSAWRRLFTPEEARTRKGRLVETYDDKQEVMLVQGKTIDGRAACAMARILRDKVGRVRAIRPWDVRYGSADTWSLDMVTLDVAWEAFLRTVIAGQRARAEPHC